MCGICPQHNILYEELTTKEHLIIFAGIKGVPAEQTEQEVSQGFFYLKKWWLKTIKENLIFLISLR